MNQHSEPEIKRILQVYGDMLYRTAYLLLGNSHDVQDVLQEVLIRYMEKAPAFASKDHEKAWLLRVTSNCCKDCLRFRMRQSCLDPKQLQEYLPAAEDRQLLQELYTLPSKWKTVLLLHYFEGYPVREISKILKLSESAVKKRLQRAREALKLELLDSNYK
ncbi:MAG: RNA polymerase sigma factor [Lachnospiraceae bacterium]|nr:RNA polymerase sigma factor [Lachnospiraceae bacterium]